MQPTARRSGLVLAIAAVAVVVAAGCAYPSAGSPACADAVLEEWTNGALTSKHPADCYEAAIDALPEDLRAYTSAADDISRASIAATRATRTDRRLTAAPAASQGEDVRAAPTLVVVLVALVALLAASGLAASAIRRRRIR